MLPPPEAGGIRPRGDAGAQGHGHQRNLCRALSPPLWGAPLPCHNRARPPQKQEPLDKGIWSLQGSSTTSGVGRGGPAFHSVFPQRTRRPGPAVAPLPQPKPASLPFPSRLSTDTTAVGVAQAWPLTGPHSGPLLTHLRQQVQSWSWRSCWRGPVTQPVYIVIREGGRAEAMSQSQHPQIFHGAVGCP